MELMKVQREIESKIDSLEKGRVQLYDAGNKKALTLAEFKKSVAITMLKLRNGKILEFEGEPIKDVPATIMEKVAEGICWNELYKKESAETLYKSMVVNLDCLESELNGLQSVNKFSDKLLKD